MFKRGTFHKIGCVQIVTSLNGGDILRLKAQPAFLDLRKSCSVLSVKRKCWMDEPGLNE